MKKTACFLLIIFLAVPACAEDVFLENFNIYAQSVFGIPQIEYQKTTSEGLDYYKAETFYLYRNESGIGIFGIDELDIISASCCALRCMDNPGSSLDQYGRIMHAYFLARSRNTGEKYNATTESNINITVQIADNTLYVWMMK